PTTPFSFGGDPKQLEDLMKQFFGGDPEQMEEMQKRAQEMMKQFFGQTPEEQEEAMKRAQEMMKQFFGEEGPNMEDLKKMLEGFRGGEGPGPEGEKPADREGADRLNKLLDEVLKGQQGDEKEPEGEKSEAPKGKAFLGISLAPVTPAIRSQLNLEEGAGVLVAGVLADGPAAKGGLEKNDVVVAIDGKKIASIEDVAGVMAKLKPGQEITLKIVRAAGEVEKKVTLGEK
ncbi:MAG: PDZ domain-containing protein, partial [Planctomycetes bacterium]|nr:PDZ domain-containing protein [Planctomycetota bacterium]